MQPDGPIVGTPLVNKEGIYFTTEVGSLYAVDREGNTRWERNIGGKIYTSPIAAGDLILIAPIESDDLLVALDANGTQQWAFAPKEEE